MEKKIRVLLADDHPVVRAGIQAFVAAESDMQVVGESTNGDQVRETCVHLKPDVLLLDMNMPGPPPADTVSHLKEHCPNTKVLVLTAYDNDFYVRGVIGAGAAGYVLKDEAPEAVVRAIRTVIKGDTWYSRPIVKKLAQWQASESAVIDETALTSREFDILKLIARGCNNAQIAEALGIAEQTTRNYISKIYEKLNVSSRAEAIVWARERNLE